MKKYFYFLKSVLAIRLDCIRLFALAVTSLELFAEQLCNRPDVDVMPVAYHAEWQGLMVLRVVLQTEQCCQLCEELALMIRK